jgi:hypothetical protein
LRSPSNPAWLKLVAPWDRLGRCFGKILNEFLWIPLASVDLGFSSQIGKTRRFASVERGRFPVVFGDIDGIANDPGAVNRCGRLALASELNAAGDSACTKDTSRSYHRYP